MLAKLTKYRAAIREALKEEMERDSEVVLLGQDIGPLGGSFAATKGLYDRFGSERVIEMPISESAIIGEALGLAVTGLRPVAELMFADFLALAMDHIVHGVAKYRFASGGKVDVPLVIRTPYGIRGHGGSGSYHSQSPESWIANVPGIYIVMPSNAKDAKGLLKASIRNNNPVLFLEHKGLYSEKSEVGDEQTLIEIGKASVVKEGTDVTIVAIGAMVHKSINVSDKLEQNGISCEIIDPRTVIPLDIETIRNSVMKTGKVIVVHEAPVFGGIGGEIVSQIIQHCFYHLHATPVRVGAKHIPVPFSPHLVKYYVPNEEDIMNELLHLIEQ
jgi:acetoin:2,6-dichlorophenolindophenol oxidoreductase subunit beta